MARAAASPSPVLTRLNREWDTRYADQACLLSPDVPVTGAVLLRRIHTSSGGVQDVLVHQLVTAAQDGDRTLERVLLQALLPVAVRLGAASADLHDVAVEDRVGCAVTAVWEAIRAYPTETTSWVFLTLTRVAEDLLAASAPVGQSAWERTVITVPDEVLAEVAGPAVTPAVPAEVRLAQLLHQAVRERVLSRFEADFLTCCITFRDGPAGVAEETDSSVGAVRKRRERLRRRLTAAYADRL